MIRIFVGTDERMGPAEIVLEHSIRKHTDEEFHITWMRSGDPPFDGWKCGFPRDGKTKRTWGTAFSPFRCFVPELAGFEGYAIYLDVDMIVLGDIAELYQYRKPGKVLSTLRPDVLVYDCSAFQDLKRIEQARHAGHTLSAYMVGLQKGKRLHKGIPGEWDHCDKYKPGATKLIHFTRLTTQPWKPWPEVFQYVPHASPEAVKLFWDLHEEAKATCA